MTEKYKRKLSEGSPESWRTSHCCLPRQHCVERNSWISAKNESAALVNVYGLQVILGNINFHEEKLRACTLYPPNHHLEFCP
jgi:hypothetical protein